MSWFQRVLFVFAVVFSSLVFGFEYSLYSFSCTQSFSVVCVCACACVCVSIYLYSLLKQIIRRIGLHKESVVIGCCLLDR